MATFEKRGDFWRAKVRRNGFPAQSRTFDNKALAERWAREIENEMDRGDFVDRTEAEKNTLAEVLKRYQKEISPTKKGADSEDYRIDSILKSRVCQTKMSALSSAHLASYRDDRLQQVSSSTVNRELNVISHAIEIARREWGIYMPENPVRLVRRPKPPRPRDRRFVKDEEKRLLAECRKKSRNPFLLPVIQLAIETGMRQSEIVRLDLSRIDLKRRFLVLPDTKNGEQRTVPLSPSAIRVIKALSGAAEGPLFPGLTTEAVKRAFKRACKRAKIENFHFHDLRHEATSRLFELGLNPMEVASITGHKTLQMLARYTHLKAANLAQKLRKS
jgi:integrase